MWSTEVCVFRIQHKPSTRYVLWQNRKKWMATYLIHTVCLSVACTGNGHNQSAEEEDTSSTYRRSENLEKVSSILELRLMHICTETAKARQAFRLQHFVSSTEINSCSGSRVPVFKNRAIKTVQCAKLHTVVPCTIISLSAECDNDHFSLR